MEPSNLEEIYFKFSILLVLMLFNELDKLECLNVQELFDVFWSMQE